MRKKIIFSVGILMLCIAAYAFYLYQKPHTGVDAIAPAYTFNAAELYAAFAQNEAAANKQYTDKVILVNGVVSEVSRTDSTLTILLESNDISGGVSCNIMNIQPESTNINKGKQVSIKGRCTGFLADVMLSDCVIEK